MFKVILMILLGLGMFFPAFSQTVQPDINNNLKIANGGITFIDGDSILLMNKDWKGICNPKEVKGNAGTNSTGVLICEWNTEKGSLTRSVTQLAGGGVQVKYDFSFKKGLDAKYMELALTIPRGCMDSMEMKSQNLKISEPVSLESLAGTLSIDPAGSGGAWYLDDLRKVEWAQKFRLRFAMDYKSELGLQGTAVLTFKAKNSVYAPFVPLKLGKSANRSFADDASKSGWTGQGGSNDLRSMPSGLMISSGVPFDISGRAVILRSFNTPEFPLNSGLIPLEPALKTQSLYVLHSVAWGEKFETVVATYKLFYNDGSSAEIPVKYGRDLNDWWMARPPTDAKLGWVGSNGSTEIGVSMMNIVNPHPEKFIKGIELVSANTGSTPILVAATAVNASIVTDAELKLLSDVFKARKKSGLDLSSWYECKIDWNGAIEPGSALDFSFMNEKPAGKRGFLKRSGTSFVFEKYPDENVRFWGTNAAIEGPFPEKDLAPGIARTFAAQGVNLVRIHLYDSSSKLLTGNDGKIKPDMLDKMEFFIAELEKNGIYIFMDLNDGLMFNERLGRPGEDNGKLKYPSIYNAELKKVTKALASELFTHVNPYTGKAMVDDPAIAMYEIINECSMLSNWYAPLEKKIAEPYLSELKALWAAWLKKNKIEERALPPHFNIDPVSRRFAIEVQKNYIDEMAAHLRSIGVKAPISATNITFSTGDLKASENMDYMGEHSYWDHPGVSARPMTYSNFASIAKPVWTLPVISGLSSASVKGYPLVIGEWNYCYPNDMRCEGLPLFAAYAAYQDWNGLIFYGATGSFDGGHWDRFRNNPGILIHSQQTDPATWGLSQIAAAMYRRGDVSTAGRELNAVVPDSAIESDLIPVRKMPFLPALGRYSSSFSGVDGKANWLGEMALSGKSAKELYEQVLEKIGDKRSDMKHVVSDTLQIRHYSEPALFIVDSPRTQSVSGRLCDFSKTDSLSDVKLNSPMAWGSFNVSSIDGKEIAKSSRLLLVAVSKAVNKTAKLDPETGLIFDMGKAPVLAEPFEALVSLRHPDGASFLSKLGLGEGGKTKVFSLDPLSGRRTAELAFSRDGEYITFSIDSSCKTIYFEIETK